MSSWTLLSRARYRYLAQCHLWAFVPEPSHRSLNSACQSRMDSCGSDLADPSDERARPSRTFDNGSKFWYREGQASEDGLPEESRLNRKTKSKIQRKVGNFSTKTTDPCYSKPPVDLSNSYPAPNSPSWSLSEAPALEASLSPSERVCASPRIDEGWAAIRQ